MAVVSKITTIDHYTEAMDGSLKYYTMRTFKSDIHKISTLLVNKKGICTFDDKRYCSDGVSALAFVHKNSSSVIAPGRSLQMDKTAGGSLLHALTLGYFLVVFLFKYSYAQDVSFLLDP
ncbi:hypothetical protein CHS0354_003471 [Potamilus streckersoni]|uniref:Uncharacterized protein n=1 Tax=Potamilus streckersoni TaxID=2493646 RepID=A0AAE0SPJ7_9BIVA|nr:hypothetical protein CHS0354_003471 [Potamilus streckersoni]